MKLLYSLAILSAAVPLSAGVRIKIENVNLTSKETTHQELLFDADRFRLNDVEQGTSVLFLTDGGRSRIVMLNPKRNEYREIDEQMAAQISQQLQGALGQMQAQLKNLPPEQRARIEEMMRGRGLPGAGAAAAVRTIYTAKGSGSVNGISCTKYEGMRGTEKVAEICAAKPSELHLTASDMQVYEKLREFAAKITAGMLNAPNVRIPDLMAEQGVDGFPVQRTSYAGNEATSKGEMKSIEHASFSDADFSLGNAKKVDLMPARGR